MSTTLNDIARRASVSISTVSRVLNNQDNVSPAVRARVLDVAKSLGYEKRSKKDSSKRIAMLLIREEAAQTCQDGLLAVEMERMLLAGAQSVLAERGIIQRIVHTQMAGEELARLTDGPDMVGVLLMGGVIDREHLAVLRTKAIPFVIAGAHARPMNVSCVMPDFHQGMTQVVEHLVQRGRGQIGLVNGPLTTTTTREKYLGLRLGLALGGLDFEDSRVMNGQFSFESGATLTEQMLKRHPELDTIIYGDDSMATGGLHALRNLGCSVPGDVAVVGCYDYEIARYTDPPLTSISFNKMRIGALAADRLCRLLSEPDDEEWFLLLPTTLAIRKST